MGDTLTEVTASERKLTNYDCIGACSYYLGEITLLCSLMCAEPLVSVRLYN